jgi:hypothetical protein
MLTIRTAAKQSAVHFFAPNLEEIWLRDKKYTPDELPRDACGAFVLDL